MLTRWTLAGLGMLALLANAAQERAPGVQRLAFTVEVDCARARAVGWNPADPGDDAVVELAARLVRRRFAAMERSAQVEVEPGSKRFKVLAPSIDPLDRDLFASMLRSLGVCELLFVDENAERVKAERAKLDAWRTAHPEAALAEFNALEPAEQGPALGLAWFETTFGGSTGPPMAVRLPAQPADHLGAAGFARTYETQDRLGYPAIGFDFMPSRANDLARVTEAHLHGRMAVVLGGKVRSAPVLESKLVRNCLIEGRFSQQETAQAAGALTKLEGPLRVIETR